MQATIGRIVHFVLPSGGHRAAIVVKPLGTSDQRVNMSVFMDNSDKEWNAGGLMPALSIPFNEAEDVGGTWHWPEREEAQQQEEHQ